jgi:hypothetical protein
MASLKTQQEDGEMKAKKLMVVLCLMVGMVAFSLGTANAAFSYFTCTISATGATGAGAPYITVTDAASPPTFTDFTFILDNSAGQANACLAAALTAWANSGNVKIFLNAPPANYDLCYSVAVVK